jgi:GNAT superfamily N-acetyltransferase
MLSKETRLNERSVTDEIEGLRIVPATPEIVYEHWKRWGLPVVSLRRNYMPEEVSGLAILDGDETVKALVTWNIEGKKAELVSLDAFPPGEGMGSLALQAAEKALAAAGIARIWLITTNNNLRAINFYLRRGYRLVAVHLNAMERVRRVKPQIPMADRNGILLRDLFEFERILR